MKTVDAGSLSIGQRATLACLLEVIAPKPGNVHRGADFEDLTFSHFAVSAVAIAPAMEAAAAGQPVGRCILDAISATRELVGSNTNLGIVLLLTPLAAASQYDTAAEGIRQVLSGLTRDDAHQVYQAIRLAGAGGLGEVEEMDLAGPSPDDLLAAMSAAAQRDLVARQYANGFEEVLAVAVPLLAEGEKAGLPLLDNLVHLHLTLMSRYPDSLIARKCGPEIAQQSADRAAAVLSAGGVQSEAYRRATADLDFWLRSDHHRRNPGTSADLATAALFVALGEGLVRPTFDTTDGREST